MLVFYLIFVNEYSKRGQEGEGRERRGRMERAEFSKEKGYWSAEEIHLFV